LHRSPLRPALSQTGAANGRANGIITIPFTFGGRRWPSFVCLMAFFQPRRLPIFYKRISSLTAVNSTLSTSLDRFNLKCQSPGRRTHSISIQGFPKIHGYHHGYPWFLDVSLQLSIQVWISTLISKQGYQCRDIMKWMFVNNKHPWMVIHVFMDISLTLSMLLWISIRISFDFYGYPCIDLLWILDPASVSEFCCTFKNIPPWQTSQVHLELLNASVKII